MGENMSFLGIDVGTTSISAAVCDDAGKQLASETLTHGAGLDGEPFADLQDADRLLRLALELYDRFAAKYALSGVGLTGQQHGIVYLDREGNAVSPLHTWRDRRAAQPYGESTYADALSQQTGYAVFPGYGLATHFYNLKHGLVPENAVTFCTIHDYVAMKLAGRTSPVTEPTDAASFGVFDLQRGAFDTSALQKAGIDPAILPEVQTACVIGSTKDGVPVLTAIGDNQASFLGATAGDPDAALLNIGTGSQISLRTDKLIRAHGLEARPFPLGGYLLAGSALTGGKAYELLKDFFEQTAFALAGDRGSGYDAMAKLLQEPGETDLVFTPLFDGTREEPEKTASVENLRRDNFTPTDLTKALVAGMVSELHGYYENAQKAGAAAPRALYGSGNGLRRNPALQKEAEKRFGMALQLPDVREEAAFGASLLARTVLKEGSHV